MTNEQLIQAIRTDRRVGRGSCTSIDECYDDAELVARFGHLTTVKAVLAAACEAEDVHIDRTLDARFGDDDDVELKIAAEWRNARGETKSQAKARRARARRLARRAVVS